MVTAGTQQAIDIVIRVLRGPQKVWVEDPGYPLTRLSLQAAGMKLCPIPVDAQGIDVKAGIKLGAGRARGVRHAVASISDRGRAVDGAAAGAAGLGARLRRLDHRGRLCQRVSLWRAAVGVPAGAG